MRGTSVLFAVVASAMLTASAAAAEDAPVPPLDPAIAQCIRDNAPKVEAAVADLAEATNFLVGSVCAEPLAAAQAVESKRASDEQAAHWKKACDEATATPDAHQKSGKQDAMSAMCASYRIGFLSEPDINTGYAIYSGLADKPPAAVALAARLLLDLRLAHKK